MNIFDIDPYVRFTSMSKMMSDFELKRRIIFDYELIYIQEGWWTLVYADEKYICRAGQFVFLRPGISHSIKVGNEGVSQPHIHFDMTYDSDSERTPISFKDIDQLSPKEIKLIRTDIFEGQPIFPIVSFSDKEEILKLFFEIISNTSGDPTAYLDRKSALLKIISALISDNFPACFSAPEKHGIEKQIKEYIDAGQGMTDGLSDFERQFSYDKFYLEKRFKAAYGMSIISYRNAKRMETAKKMLESESVSAVTEKMGYTSIYSFSRAFKLHFGFPPSQVFRGGEE